MLPLTCAGVCMCQSAAQPRYLEQEFAGVPTAGCVGAPGVCRGVTLVPALFAGCVEGRNATDHYAVPTECKAVTRAGASDHTAAVVNDTCPAANRSPAADKKSSPTGWKYGSSPKVRTPSVRAFPDCPQLPGSRKIPSTVADLAARTFVARHSYKHCLAIRGDRTLRGQRVGLS
jgi:hypothetical protein